MTSLSIVSLSLVTSLISQRTFSLATSLSAPSASRHLSARLQPRDISQRVCTRSSFTSRSVCALAAPSHLAACVHSQLLRISQRVRSVSVCHVSQLLRISQRVCTRSPSTSRSVCVACRCATSRSVCAPWTCLCSAHACLFSARVSSQRVSLLGACVSLLSASLPAFEAACLCSAHACLFSARDLAQVCAFWKHGHD